jgi:hypothetical protein
VRSDVVSDLAFNTPPVVFREFARDSALSSLMIYFATRLLLRRGSAQSGRNLTLGFFQK